MKAAIFLWQLIVSAGAFSSSPVTGVGRTHSTPLRSTETDLSSPTGTSYTLDGEEIRGPMFELKEA